ncbi:MAG: helix-turn-helix domain-containing protein [Magnetospirillum sp.]|jgi:DNA-binding transcriptional MerR regulator|uniref:Transcriptional regulator MerR family n=1 Tax=Paramagnetospirillum magnetotacticum MS-1 TaxID=272627 RepID=A0A0C2YHB9_PARME|nr:helix-turn-helix domain-containing protein [Paramagnetospirillum magnetotacticum]KIL99099.1 Transcriptional regulator MerR family [Paramagnetospirillum magnetotacticum MS-1]MBI3445664.1 helix-turn-helix domain-containing protein [Magnetospirillum sp.]
MTTGTFNIGRLGERAGVNIETIRYYEKIGLLPEPGRTAAGYRQYGEDHLRRLSFIRKGRDLGFSIEAIRALLRLAEHPEQPCEDADRLASAHLAEVERKIEELGRLRDALSEMAHCCAGTVAECRIIDALAS